VICPKRYGLSGRTWPPDYHDRYFGVANFTILVWPVDGPRLLGVTKFYSSF